MMAEAVKTILESAAGFEDSIEIIISDNGSSDNTSEVGEAFARDHSFIRFIRKPTNLGVFRHFIELVREAQGEYVWLFGDDDRITKDAVGKVLAKLTGDCNFVICNHAIYSIDFSTLFKERVLHVSSDQEYDSPEAVLETFGISFGYITAVVLRRDKALILTDEDRERFSGYGLPVLYDIYASLKLGGVIRYIAEPIVLNRAENSNYYNWNHYFVEGAAEIFNGLERSQGYSKRSVFIARDKVLRELIIPRMILSKLSDGVASIPLPSIFKYYSMHSDFWTVCVPLSLLTSSAARARTGRLHALIERLARKERRQAPWIHRIINSF